MLLSNSLLNASCGTLVENHFVYYAPLSLSRLFGRYIRIDIRNFINNVRIQHVIALKNLPENNEKSIIDLAFQCGFNSVSSFYRAYNKLSYSVSSTSEAIDEGSM